MNVDRLDWALCRSFLAILREGSLSGAARRLNLAHPTIRRHLDELEATLGSPLFARSQTGLVPTALGLDLRDPAEAMESAAAALVRLASAETGAIAGTVRITASEMIGVEVLPPILSQLRAAHPALDFELVLTSAIQDIARRDADIAIRMVRPIQPGLVVRKLGIVPLGLYAHRRWVAAHGLPASRAALVASRHLIGPDRENHALLQAFASQGVHATAADFGLRCDSDLAQLAAIRAGLGVGVVQAGIAARDPDLVRILPDAQLGLEIWLAMPPGHRAIARLRVAAEVLATGLSAYARNTSPTA